MGFQVSRAARDKHRFEDKIISDRGTVVLSSFHDARQFAQRINADLDVAQVPEKAVKAGQINALGLISEILSYVFSLYVREKNPEVRQELYEFLVERQGQPAVDKTLETLAREFPTNPVYHRQLEPAEWLENVTGEIPNRELALERMLMLWLANVNPACSPYLPLFDDDSLEGPTRYCHLLEDVQEFFLSRPHFGPEAQLLIEMLRSPALAVPHSLSGQLEYILQRWSMLLGQFLYRILGSLDLIKEEEKPIFPGGGPGPARVYEFSGQELEMERFSPDDEWMPRLVMLAKNAYVWLDQLSRKYQRSITQLDQIPEEELDTLARWGLSGLWLIGLWERSPASKTVKQWCGNPDAVSSAYSLYEYQIANDLGGEAACQVLREQAARRGIRLASDMVTG